MYSPSPKAEVNYPSPMKAPTYAYSRVPTVCLLVGGWGIPVISAIQLCNLILCRILYWCGSTPASTALRKSVRFLHNKYIFNDKTHFPSWNLANILSERLGNPGRGTLGGWNPKNFPGEPAFAFCARLENRPVFILDPRLLYTAYVFSDFSDYLSRVLKYWSFEAHQPTLLIYRSDFFYNAWISK